jgi:hypothetical protein
MVRIVSVDKKPFWMIEITPTATLMLEVDPAGLSELHDDIGMIIVEEAAKNDKSKEKITP